MHGATRLPVGTNAKGGRQVVASACTRVQQQRREWVFRRVACFLCAVMAVLGLHPLSEVLSQGQRVCGEGVVAYVWMALVCTKLGAREFSKSIVLGSLSGLRGRCVLSWLCLECISSVKYYSGCLHACSTFLVVATVSRLWKLCLLPAVQVWRVFTAFCVCMCLVLCTQPCCAAICAQLYSTSAL